MHDLRKAKGDPAAMWALLGEAGELLAAGKPLPAEWAKHIGEALQAAAREAKHNGKAEQVGGMLARKLDAVARTGAPTIVPAQEVRAADICDEFAEMDGRKKRTREQLAEEFNVSVETIRNKRRDYKDAANPTNWTPEEQGGAARFEEVYAAEVGGTAPDDWDFGDAVKGAAKRKGRKRPGK